METLARIFTGDLAVYRDAFVFSEPEGPCLPAVDLLQPDSFGRIVAPFVARYPGADRRAVVSFWIQWYFGVLIPPAVAVNLVLDVDLPLALDDAGVLIDQEEHRPRAFRLPHGGHELEPDADPFRRFHTLVSLHLEPLVDAVAESNGLATRLLWSNAGSYFDWIVREITEPGTPSPGLDLLNSPTRSDGSRNPLFRPVRKVDDGGEEVLRRRICCLRYLIPGVGDCGSRCPLDL